MLSKKWTKVSCVDAIDVTFGRQPAKLMYRNYAYLYVHQYVYIFDIVFFAEHVCILSAVACMFHKDPLLKNSHKISVWHAGWWRESMTSLSPRWPSRTLDRSCGWNSGANGLFIRGDIIKCCPKASRLGGRGVRWQRPPSSVYGCMQNPILN